jgi:peptide/nickel transport system permease protein
LGKYLLKRLLYLVPVIIGVVTVSFVIIHLVPGDPVRTYLGEHATPANTAALRHAWGLDRPLISQYFHFWTGLFTGDLGMSQYFRAPVFELIRLRLPVTLLLMLFATIFAIAIAVPLAFLSARHPNGVADVIVRVLNAVLQGMPTFWLGTILVLLFSLKFHWFPSSGYGTTPAQHIYYLILPSVTVALFIVPLLIKSLRESIINILPSEYVAFGYAKGLSKGSVERDYVLRNGSMSAIGILGIQVGGLAGGSLVVENVFAIPGMGSLMMNAIMNRDFPVVQTVTFFFSLIVVLVFVLTDLAYAWLDPRVRLGFTK